VRTKRPTKRSAPRTHLEGQKEKKRLHTVVASVDEVSHEEVVGVGAVTAYFKELLQVVELTMDVTADL
jgi:hypothetical protein